MQERTLDAWRMRLHRYYDNYHTLPLTLPAGAVDQVMLRVLKAFFAADEWPHYRQLPESWAQVGHIYGSTLLRRQPALFFKQAQLPDDVQLKHIARLPHGEKLHITFQSNYQTYYQAYQATYDSFVGNEVVHARVWRHRGMPRPTVLCIHGWQQGGSPWLEEKLFACHALYEANLNVALVVLPFHGPRKPAGRFAWNLLPSSDFRRTHEGVGQAVQDVRAITQWLRQAGIAQSVGLLGFSLGGYVSALIAGLPQADMFAFIVPMIAPASLADLIWNLNVDVRGKQAASAAGFNVTVFRDALALQCPLTYQLQLPKDRLLIVGGHSDQIVTETQILKLWRHFKKPPLAWFTGSHYVHVGRQHIFEKITDLASRA